MFPVAIGLSVREPWIEELLRLSDRGAVDVLEVMIDEVLHCGGVMAKYRRLGSRWPLVAHGVGLGIGNADGLDLRYVDAIAEAATHLRVRWYSDHLCFLSAGGVSLEHFAPLEDEPDALAVLAENAGEVTRRVQVPLLLENPADVLGLGAQGRAAGTRRGQAFSRSLGAAQSGAILDVTNLLYNSRNDGFDAVSYIDALALDRVVQIHVAGGREIHGLWIDSHDRAVEPESLDLLRHAARRCPNLRAVTIEWDEELPTLDVLLGELSRVRDMLTEEGRR